MSLECSYIFYEFYLGRDNYKWRLHPHSSWSFLPQVAWSLFISLHSLSFLFSLLFSLQFRHYTSFLLFIISLIVLPFYLPFQFDFFSPLSCFIFCNHHHHLSNCVFLLLFWRELSHLLNHLVKYMSNANFHWVSPIIANQNHNPSENLKKHVDEHIFIHTQ